MRRQMVVEITFSRNKIFKNRIFECDYGIWGGYSYNTEIANNQFRNNNVGIAIEHGQENDIHHNLFFKDKMAIKLWAERDNPQIGVMQNTAIPGAEITTWSQQL